MRGLFLAIIVALTVGVGCSPKEGSNYTHVKESDAAMNAAIEKAKSSVGQFVTALHARKPGTSDFYVKKPYATPDGSFEHMWIEVQDEKEGTIKGTIANEAEETREVKNGQKVTLKTSDISDWKYLDGKKLVGGYTIRYFVEKMPQKERKEFLEQAGFEL